MNASPQHDGSVQPYTTLHRGIIHELCWNLLSTKNYSAGSPTALSRKMSRRRAAMCEGITMAKAGVVGGAVGVIGLAGWQLMQGPLQHGGLRGEAAAHSVVDEDDLHGRSGHTVDFRDPTGEFTAETAAPPATSHLPRVFAHGTRNAPALRRSPPHPRSTASACGCAIARQEGLERGFGACPERQGTSVRWRANSPGVWP